MSHTLHATQLLQGAPAPCLAPSILDQHPAPIFRCVRAWSLPLPIEFSIMCMRYAKTTFNRYCNMKRLLQDSAVICSIPMMETSHFCCPKYREPCKSYHLARPVGRNVSRTLVPQNSKSRGFLCHKTLEDFARDLRGIILWAHFPEKTENIKLGGSILEKKSGGSKTMRDSALPKTGLTIPRWKAFAARRSGSEISDMLMNCT